MLINRDTLLAILKDRFDYYSAQAVTKELLSSLDMQDWTDFDEDALGRICAYLEEKIPGSEDLVARLKAPPAPAPEAATEAPAEPAPEAAPEAAPAEEAPADDEKPKKKAAKKKK
jgi:hypothetical protein